MAKKQFLFLSLIVLFALLSFAACSGGDGGESAQGNDPASSESGETDEGSTDAADLGSPVSMNLGHPFPTSDYRAMAMQRFADLCDEYSDGNISVTPFPSQTLVTSQDALKSTANGSADIGMGSLSFNTSEVPALAPLDIQGIYDPDYFWETYEIIKPTLDKILETQNQKGLMIFDETDSVFYLNKKNQKDVHSPADIGGLRLRDHGMWIGKSISEWGASPQTVMPADIAVALDKGTVDGGFTGWGFIHSYRCFENAPYISYAKIAKSCWSPMAVNLDVWNGLSAGQQDIMIRAAAEAQEYGKDLIEEQFNTFKADVENSGGTIYYLTEEENQVFVDAAIPLIEECRQSSGELGNELIDALLSAPSNYR
ncbi:MAG: TRAP transporter substrate-binding protein [Clostridiales Family XIII bacterium]|nr:TRAP transporter substrate-binding protein [Clostridiales Family XIII bacterium]